MLGTDLGRQRQVFERLVAVALRHLERSEDAAAAAVAQLAAEYAWRRHAGTFASQTLETLGRRIGERAALRVVPAPRHSDPGDDRPRLLHVMTEAYATGGHTQNVWRWIEEDKRRAHTLALTRQGSLPVPELLERVIAASGGGVVHLDQTPGDLLFRASALARLAATSDEVVLHVHPFDIVPLIALTALEERPPVVLLNHADHVFWLGVTVADVVVHARSVAVSLAEDRRDVPAERSVIFPFPIPPAHAGSRPEAKRALGLDPGGVLLVTAASGYKYASGDEPGLVELVVPVLERHPDARLIALGPRDAGMWATGRQATRGRLTAIGYRDDVTPYLGAADVYLDSTPLTSVSSLLEAGQHELPLVRFSASPDPRTSLFEPNYPALESTVLTTGTPEEFRRLVSKLIDDPKLRSSIGERSRRAVVDKHSGPAFGRSLERIHRQAATAPRREPRMQVREVPAGQVDTQLATLHANSHVAPAFVPATHEHIRLVPLRHRAGVWLEVLRALRGDSAIAAAWMVRYLRRRIRV